MKKILITGAAGFIGSNLLESLFYKYPDYSFIVVDSLTYAGNLKNIPAEIQASNRFRFVHNGIRDSIVMDDLVGQSDIVIHLAAETHVSRSINNDFHFVNTNILGTQALIKAVNEHKNKVERFLYISTCEVYGAALTDKMDENHPLNPHSPYAATKAGADRLVYSYFVSYNTPVVILRPFNIYGARQHLEKLIPRLITSALHREPLIIHGTGEAQRDYLHVSDLISAIDLVLHAPLEKVIGEVFNIGSGKAISINEIAQMIATLMRKFDPVVHYSANRPGQVATFTCNYGKIEKLLGWKPQMKFIEGMSEAISWYKENQDIWRDQYDQRLVPIRLPDGNIEMQ